jgi:hypothetical protein
MVLRSIHIGEEETELRNEIKNEVEQFEKRITDLAIKFKKIVNADNVFEKRVHKDACKLLHTIFQPNFVQEIIFNLDTMPEKILTIEDLEPHRCNYPSEMTLRTKNFHGNGVAPCKRRLGQTNVYFCSLPRHLAYAKKLKLPVNQDDLIALNLPIPPRPVGGAKVKHVRQKHKRKGGVKSPMKDDDATLTEENYVHIRTIVGDQKEEIVYEERPAKRVKHQEEECEGEVPRFQCVYNSLIDGSQCPNDGLYRDPFQETFLYCNNHIQVTDELLEELEEVEIDGNVLRDLRQIQLLDDDILELLENENENSEEIRRMCSERYFLSTNHGFGIHPRLSAFL